MADRQERAATRTDVARLAGVSTAVVSYVVNDGPRGVSTDARERVLEAIRTLDYRPNPSARALKTGSTGLIGVVTSDITNPHYAEFVEAIDAAAGATGRSLMLGISHGDSSGEAGIIRSLLNRGIDGLLLINCRLSDGELSALGVDRKPCVLMDRAQPTTSFPSVGADLVGGARLAVEHLADHGHERIAYVGGPLFSPQIDHRRLTYEAVLRERGLPHLEPAITEWNRDGGYEAAKQLLAHDEPPTAIFAGSDLTAIGVLNGIRDLGRSVPDDLAVASLDGTKESAYVTPALTTVRQPLDLMAETAVDILADSADPNRPTSFPIELIIRGSCGCHPPTAGT